MKKALLILVCLLMASCGYRTYSTEYGTYTRKGFRYYPPDSNWRDK